MGRAGGAGPQHVLWGPLGTLTKGESASKACTRPWTLSLVHLWLPCGGWDSEGLGRAW